MRFAMLMPRSLLPWSLVLLLALGTSSFAAVPFVYVGSDDKPADPEYSYARSVFNCLPPDSLSIIIDNGTTLSDSTRGRDALINSYPCAPWAENGPELIYRLIVMTDLELTANIVSDEATVDHDLFLLNDCDSDSCLIGENVGFRANLSAGVYFLVVDTTKNLGVEESGGFTLDLSARPLGVPESICAPGGALPIDCAGETISIVAEDLFGQPDLMQVFDCGSSPKTSGELWYVITLPGTHEVTIEVINVVENLDPNLWLFDDCGPTAQCLRFVDDNIGGIGETLTWINETEGPMVAYLAVDAVRPPTAATLGQYSINFECQSNVATVSTSFGSLKALYR